MVNSHGTEISSQDALTLFISSLRNHLRRLLFMVLSLSKGVICTVPLLPLSLSWAYGGYMLELQ